MSKLTLSTFVTSFAITAALSSAPAHANLDSQFSSCASKALESKSLSARKINVALPKDSAIELDHSPSQETHEFKMKLVNKSSGEFLGKVICQVNSQGEVLSAKYASKS